MTRRSLTLALSIACAALAVLFNAPRSSAFPEPNLVPRTWEFDFTYDAPKPIAIRQPDGSFKWYWYLKYKVVNNSGKEQLFIPEVTVATDEGDIITAGKNVPQSVFDAVKRAVGNRLLESPVTIVGKVLLGDDNARESVAIWPDYGHDVNDVNIFVGGLSGETSEVKIASQKDPVLVTKTLELDYQLPGYPKTPQDQPVVARGKTWVMR